jgi:hypothetical protein
MRRAVAALEAAGVSLDLTTRDHWELLILETVNPDLLT